MKRTFFSLALLLAVATLTAQTKMTAREAAVKIADRILASTTYEFKNTKTGEIEEFTDNMLSNDDYRQYLGNALPKLYLGWNNSFRYKNFDLSFQMTGQFGFKILNEPRAYYENNSIAYNRLKSVQKAPYGGQYTLSTAQKQTFVSYYLEDGDFLKMTNITLG